ncbi:Protein containing Laminin G domain [sediment metagenome]|uniref:Protein containing Laminin G domain n=1 Tax=sediment metagenome TaxID=749907 RepID=D9PFH9_9ZZZZ
MIADESGEPGNPIRLTVDPSWGEGEAVISGSVKITGGWVRGAENTDIPEPAKVWYCDLDFAPRNLWMIKDKEITRIPLARMPNWKISDPEDIKSEWWYWDYPGSKYFSVFMKNEQGRELILGIDTKNLTGPKELYMGAISWTEFGWVDGTPYPSRVQGYDAEKKGIGFEGYLGSPRSRIIARNHRYYLEDKPHYLDDPDGEFWFDKKGDGGRLHVILPGGVDPNTVEIEAGKESTLIHMEEKQHINISGLSFRYSNVSWDLTELPWGVKYALKKHVHPACIRVWGGGKDIRVSNCVFNHVNAGIFMKAVKPGLNIDEITITDCEIRETDHGGITIQEGIQYGDAIGDEAGHLLDVKVLRNYIYKAGQRPMRVGSANAIDVSNGQTVEIAGNIIEKPWHAGVNVHGAKISGNVRDVPLVRVLIYQNKVIDGIRTGDDCGNIETWQGGVAYVYNNLSGNPGGFRNASWIDGKDNPNKPGSARFGMAYYLDGAFKNYYFNNIGWGLSKDPWSRVGATTMFQEIISYQNSFFNNTAYNFVKGTRRQAPQAGSNKYLGNIWDGIGDWVFWHTTPARSAAAGNEMDAGPQKNHYALETNAFTGNIFYDITGKYGSFKPSGQWHISFEESRNALKEVGSIADDLGVVAQTSPMKNPANHDFSLTNSSPAIDRGVKVFVPWSLYATVGEWSFYPAGNDPAHILDEHWYMASYYYSRNDYYTKPMFHLKGVNIGKNNYLNGPLEDWTKGALQLNGKDQYAVCSNDTICKSFSYTIKFRWDENGKTETRKVTGKDFKSPQVFDSNFLIEAYLRTEPKFSKGVIAEKMSGAGYSLEVNEKGGVTFTVTGEGKSVKLNSGVAINDGKWHHIIAEADRAAKTLTLYINGKKDKEGPGIAGNISLENKADLYVGGTPGGRYFKGTLEFLRICLGTLADAKTDIDELYAWEFDGPFLRDFTGNEPHGKRDAGALEKR